MNDETKAIIKLLCFALILVLVITLVCVLALQFIHVPEGGFLGGGYDK